MSNAPVTVPTIQTRVLPGWMTRDNAISFFTNQCVPSRSPEEAIAVWKEYRNRASKLPLDRGSSCARLPLDAEDQSHAQQFMDFLNAQVGGHSVSDVIKVDISQMIVHQYEVITERSMAYANKNRSDADWRTELLPPNHPPQAQVGMQFSLGIPHNAHPMSSQIVIDLPHSEFAFLPAQNGFFGPSQFMRYVSVCERAQKILLKAGYHRSFARLTSAPPATVPTALVALERNTWVLPVNHPPDGAGVTVGATELHPSGRIPALFSDFVTDGLFMDVLQRRKRFQLRVQSTWTAIDDI